MKLFSLQGKAPKEIHAILTETIVCSLPGRANDLSAPLYFVENRTYHFDVFSMGFFCHNGLRLTKNLTILFCTYLCVGRIAQLV